MVLTWRFAPMGATVALGLGLGLLSPAAMAEKPTPPINLADTEWVGKDTPDNLITTYRFERGGTLAYFYNGTSYRNGTWRQTGNTIYFETNTQFRETRGTIKGDQIEGNSWNVRKERWKTTIYRYYKPN
jgi:hypothetical protein